MSQKLVFLSYINRSGSTYLANLLGNHNNICVTPEAEILISELLSKPEKIIKQKDIFFLKKKFLSNTKLKAWDIPEKDLISIVTHAPQKNSFQLFCEILKKYVLFNKPNATIIVFKGTRLLWLYNKNPFFNRKNVFLLNIIRDGRAAYASQKKAKGSLKGKPMSQNVLYTALMWNQFVSIINTLNKETYTIQYEKLLKNRDDTLNQILDSLNIKYDDLITSKEYNNNSIKLPPEQKHLHQNINKPPDLSRIHSWKNELSDNEIKIFNTIAYKNLNFYNYNYSFPKNFNIKILMIIIVLWIKFIKNIKIPKLFGKTKKLLKRTIRNSSYA